MQKISELIKVIEDFAPLELASSWDNSGWQIYLGDKLVDKVLLALTPSLNIIEQAIEQGFQLIISHHPLMFNKINKLSINDYSNLAVIKAISAGVQIYSAHTNLDSTNGGIADELAKLLNLKNLVPLIKITEKTGLGRIGDLQTPLSLDEVIKLLKKVLNCNVVKVINPFLQQEVKRIALCPGSGIDLINKAGDADVFIAGDMKYHSALEVNNLIVIDAGHFETERIILPVLKNLLDNNGVNSIIANENEPWLIL